MTREEVQRRLSEQRAELTSLGVRSLHVFGSVARGDSAPDSDVDLLVDFDRPIGLFHFFRVQQRLERILGSRVDLVMREAVKPQSAIGFSARPSVPPREWRLRIEDILEAAARDTSLLETCRIAPGRSLPQHQR